MRMSSSVRPLHFSIVTLSAILALLFVPIGVAQQTVTDFSPTHAFDIPSSDIEIRQSALPREPFSVAGESGAIFGQQDGSFELWRFPVKIFSRVHITAELKDYPVPIDLNTQAATIAVSPDHTTITYSHAAIVVKQHMFVSRERDEEIPGAVVLFEIRSVRPATLTIQLQPIMQRQWPAASPAFSGASWIKIGQGGGYVLATDDPHFYGAVAIPQTQPGILAPYQERPKYYPLEFKLAFDPNRDKNVLFPLIAIFRDSKKPLNDEAKAAMGRKIAEISTKISALYEGTRKYYDHFFEHRVTVETPDKSFDRALKWAEVSIDQLKAAKGNQIGLVAGWYSSGDSARPGFGWFFGRDTLWSLYAVHSYGDFALARQALEFLIARQRSDGKIMHEYSQTADFVDWKGLPYEFAAADSTPLFMIVMEDYVRNTGDVAFLRRYWQNVKKAYDFTRAHDSDGDGIYDNSEGTGWVESWPQGMPHQELYLAALDQQSAESMSLLAALVGDRSLAQSCSRTAEQIKSKLSGYLGSNGLYAFSRNRDGSLDYTSTVFPTVAWWTGHLALPNAEKSFESWASSDLSTDWGLRAVSVGSPIFDPISYHQGSVWPLFTGWASLAEYRTGRSLSAYSHLRQNLDLTWSHDPGAITELLSGQFNEPLGRSTAHQLWSSAMVLTPALRGLFGIESDVPHRTLRISPSLPASWTEIKLHNVPFGSERLEISMTRRNAYLDVTVSSEREIQLCLTKALVEDGRSCSAPPTRTRSVELPLPLIEVIPQEEPSSAGAETSNLKVLSQTNGVRTLELLLEAPAGSTKRLGLKWNSTSRPTLSAEGAELVGGGLTVRFTTGEGYVRQRVVLRFEIGL